VASRAGTEEWIAPDAGIWPLDRQGGRRPSTLDATPEQLPVLTTQHIRQKGGANMDPKMAHLLTQSIQVERRAAVDRQAHLRDLRASMSPQTTPLATRVLQFRSA
jgi:hypothetical protein